MRTLLRCALALLAGASIALSQVPGQPIANPDPAITSPSQPELAAQQPTPAAQQPEALPPPPVQQGRPLDELTATALQRLADDLSTLRSQLQAAAERGDPPLLQRLRDEEQQKRWQFAKLASGLDVQEFEVPTQQKFDVQKELLELLQPLVRSLKDATAGPRESSELTGRIERVEARREMALAASNRIAATRDALPTGSPAHAEADRELREHWQPLLRDLGTELLVLNANKVRLDESKQDIWTTITEKVRSFLKTSGLSVLLSVVAFVVVFFGLLWIGRWTVGKRRRADFSSRLAGMLARGTALLLAIVATLSVLFVRDDWLLLAIFLLFLLGAGWVIIKTAPQFLAEFRLMLNIGPVREGERLLVNGLPYRVDSLRFHSRLSNPALAGGLLRVPIRDLLSQRSRPCANDEPWFPCQQGDVVALSDGVVGRVVMQTPEVVVVAERRDAPHHYPTQAFLQLNPRNLSGGFEVVVKFGVDYRHQAVVLHEVPKHFEQALQNGLDAAIVRHIVVEFAAANDSSLDLHIVVGFVGDVAQRFPALRRRVQALLVEACNTHRYSIPFPQLTVHGIGRQGTGGQGIDEHGIDR